MARADFAFFHPFRVRYAEVDAQAVVFNAHYLTYFDTAITEYFRHVGFDQIAEAKATGVDYHTVRTVVDYKAPIRLDQEIEVGVRLARIGRTSVAFALSIFPKGGAGELANGEVIWVNTDQKLRTPVPVSDRHRRLLESGSPAPAGSGG
jgi:acyl-CoA thioester hydrolase